MTRELFHLRVLPDPTCEGRVLILGYDQDEGWRLFLGWPDVGDQAESTDDDDLDTEDRH